MEQKTGRVGGLEVGALCKCPFLVGSFLSEFCVFFFGPLDGFFSGIFWQRSKKKKWLNVMDTWDGAEEGNIHVA